MSTEQFKIEMVIRKKNTDLASAPTNFLEIFNEYKTIENENRLTVDLPIDWEGFKNGTIVDILKYFNESVYVGIAYLTDNDYIKVTDFENKLVDMYDETVNGLAMKKYVNKRLRITKILDAEADKFDIKGYLLDLKFVEPIIKVLDIYSAGKESGISLDTFNIRSE